MKSLLRMFCLACLVAGCAQVTAIFSPAPAPSPPPPPAARPAPKPPPPVLSPQVGEREEDRLKQAVTLRIEGTEQIVRQIDQAKLARDQQEMFLTIQSFIAKAKEAMSAKDFQRAYNLADKAQVLADELARALR